MEQNTSQGKLGRAVQDFYETYGPAFAQSRFRGWGVMRLVHEKLKPGNVLLDIGAGNSRLADELDPSVRYVAVEPSSTLREAARQRLSKREGVEIREGGFPSVPARDGEADVVACLAVLHHIPTHGARVSAIAELGRILKPGGALILTAWNLRGVRMFSLKNWLAAWLRFPMVRGGEGGDAWIPWRANGASALRFVHACTLSELRQVFPKHAWEVERLEAWDDRGPSSVLKAGNLVVVARKRAERG